MIESKMKCNNEENIKEIITQCLLELCDTSYIDPTSNLVRDIGLDSLGLVYFATSLEESFDILIADWEISNSENFSTIDKVTLFIKKKLKQRSEEG